MTNPSITVYVNGEARPVPSGRKLAELVDAHTPSRSGVAVAVDEVVISRTEWAEHELADGARIEILTAVQGG